MNKLALSLVYAVAFVGVHNVAFAESANILEAPAVCARMK